MERARGACRPRERPPPAGRRPLTRGLQDTKPIHVTITTRGGRRARFTVQRIRVPPCNPTHATTIRGLENAVWAGNIRFSHSDGTKGRTPTSLYALGSSCRCIAYEECAECHEPMCDDCLWGDSNLEALRGTPRPAMNAVHSSASIAAPSHCPATWGNALR